MTDLEKMIVAAMIGLLAVGFAFVFPDGAARWALLLIAIAAAVVEFRYFRRILKLQKPKN